METAHKAEVVQRSSFSKKRSSLLLMPAETAPN